MNYGREAITLVEIDQPFCTRTYGSSPCAAVLGTTGAHKCFNTRATCQDSVNYDGDEFGAPYLSLPGIAGNFASTPDSAAISIAGDIDIRIKLAANDYTPAAIRYLVRKGGASGTQSFFVGMRATGAWLFDHTVDGTTILSSNIGTEPSPAFVDGATTWVRWTLDVDNGAGGYVKTFYKSSDGITWTAVGSPIVGSGTTSIFDGPSVLSINQDGDIAGKVFYVEIRNGIGGPVVAKFDPSANDAAYNAPSIVSETGERWTVATSGGTPAKLISPLIRPRFSRSQDGLLGYGPLIPSLASESTTAGAINLGGQDQNAGSLGTREVVTLKFEDHRHSDILVDRYRLQRATGEAAMSAGELEFDFTRASFVPVVSPRPASVTLTSFARSGTTATRTDATGIIVGVAANTPRFDYDPITLACKGLLIEEARTNTSLQNTAFDNAAWTKNGTNFTVTADQALAPDGTTGMDKITKGDTTGTHIAQTLPTLAGETWTRSIYIKPGTIGKIFFEFNDGGSFTVPGFDATTGQVLAAAGATCRVDLLPNGVYRFSATKTWTNNGFGGTIYVHSGYTAGAIGDLYLWGDMFEKGACATSLIFTTAAAVTRNSDDPRVSDLTGGWFNAAASTYFAEWQGLPGASGNGSNSRIIGFTDSRTPLSYNSGPGPSITVGAWDGTLAQNYAAAQYLTGTIGRVVCAFTETTDRAFSFNGFPVALDTGANYGTPTAFCLGSTANTLQVNGHLRRFTYYPRRVTNAQVLAISAGALAASAIVPFVNSYDPYVSGTFWGKWLARNPYNNAYKLRVYQGYAGDALSAMRVRTYLVDRVEGPTDGDVTVVAKDLFSSIEAQKAVAPLASLGELFADITAVAGSATLAPAGIGNANYPASGTLVIGSECITFTRSADALTLTARGALNTTADVHKAQDLVQVALVYTAQLAMDIVYDLLLNYTSLVAGDLPKSAWDAAAVDLTNLYTGRIATPTPVVDLVGELAQQAGFSIWPDTPSGQIQVAALRAASIDVTFDDRGGIVEKSLSIKRQTERRASQVWVYYGQVDPTVAIDQKNNFHSRLVSGSLASEGTDQFGQAAIREVFSRWIPQFGRSAAQDCGERLAAMFVIPPIEATFRAVVAREDDVALARYFYLSAADVQDDTGAALPVAMAAVSLDRGENEIEIRAQEVTFAAPSGGTGTRVIYIENDSLNLDMRVLHDSLFATPVGTETVNVIVSAGIKVGSSSTSTPALQTGSWPAGVTLQMTNLGRIEGAGGQGSSGDWFGIDPPPPLPGGPALKATYAIAVTNAAGQIWAGGGGGGAGGAGTTDAGGGGGGGAGYVPGVGLDTGFNFYNVGQTGTTDAGGLGGTGRSNGGNGGAGGGPGLSGAHGSDGAYPGTSGTAGAAAGNYITGNSFVTWVSNGDRRGGVV